MHHDNPPRILSKGYIDGILILKYPAIKSKSKISFNLGFVSG